jgi:hypothetical protein
MNNGTFRRLFHSCVINIALRTQIIIINIRIGRGGSVEEVNSDYLAMVRYGGYYCSSLSRSSHLGNSSALRRPNHGDDPPPVRQSS